MDRINKSANLAIIDLAVLNKYVKTNKKKEGQGRGPVRILRRQLYETRSCFPIDFGIEVCPADVNEAQLGSLVGLGVPHRLVLG